MIIYILFTIFPSIGAAIDYKMNKIYTHFDTYKI